MLRVNLPPSRKPIVIASVIAALILLTPFVLDQIFPDETSRRTINDLFSPLSNLCATAALFYAAQKSLRLSRKLAWGWAILGAAQFCLLAGDIIWAIYELGLQISPFPSPADMAYLLFYAFFLAGILWLPARRFGRVEGLKRALDITIVLIASSLAFWNFLIGPVIANGIGSGASFLDQILSAAYPVGDLVMLYALLVILYRRSDGENPRPLWLLAAGIVFTIISDVIFSYQTLEGTFSSGSLLDLTWMLGYLLTGMAGVVHAVWADAHPAGEAAAVKLQAADNHSSTWLSYFSYAWVLGAYLLMVQSHFSHDQVNYWAISAGVGAIIALVILRQVVSLNEIQRLLDNLTTALEKVNRQASELDAVNHSLQQEISDRKRIQQQLSYDALHDELTGLPNRVLLMDRLDHAVDHIQRKSGNLYSVLFLDVDAFKVINDSLGHSAGDFLLVEISKRLKACVRSIDTVARFGGDEFVVLLENISGENIAVLVADRIQAEMARPFEHKGQQVHATCSIGIIKTIADFASSEEILRDADVAMYWAKSAGKARYEVFNPDLRAAAITRMEIENELRRALINHELYLHYQPIYSFDTNLFIGFEALLRWQNPYRGMVIPSDFIPIAEETGLIVPIGDWVMLEAASQLKNWIDQFPDLDYLTVNVNISGKQLTQTDFVDKVRGAIAQAGIDPYRLNLEITENVMVSHQKLMKDIFSELGKFGVKLLVDDFGTGYSSLAFLQYFPVNTLTIDRSFIQDMNRDKKSHDLVKTIIQMAQELGLETIAEGVETDSQLRELRSMACKQGQGFLLAKPMAPDAIEKLLAQQANPVIHPRAETLGRLTLTPGAHE